MRNLVRKFQWVKKKLGRKFVLANFYFGLIRFVCTDKSYCITIFFVNEGVVLKIGSKESVHFLRDFLGRGGGVVPGVFETLSWAETTLSRPRSHLLY